MRIIGKNGRYAAAPQRSVTALGFFDGMHRGHAALFREARRLADGMGLPFFVFSFASDRGPKRACLLQSDRERVAAFFAAGADFCTLAPFPEYAGFGPCEFVNDILCNRLGTIVAVAGENFCFGAGASGDMPLLTALMAERGGSARTVPSVSFEGIPISSELIRRALFRGDCARAAQMLGRPYSFTLPVLHGQSRGHGLGFPTANQLPPPWRALPGDGVYRTVCRTADGRTYDAVTDIGLRPTFGGEERRAESHLIGFSGNLYGRRLTVAFFEKLRDEEKFDSVAELIARVQKDKERVLAWKRKNGTN